MIAMLTFAGRKRNPVAVLILHYRSNWMRFRNPCKVSWIQPPNGNGTAIDNYPLLLNHVGRLQSTTKAFVHHAVVER